MSLLEPLYEAAGLPRWELPPELERLYGGSFGLAEECVVANFVETLDGVVAIPDVERSNALIADGSEADRFLMGLLRASAEAVVIGSGTLLSSPQGTWRPDRVHPASAAAYAELRAARGLPERPAVAVVTGGGSLDPSHPLFETGAALVLTTARAAERLRALVPSASEVVAVSDGDAVDLVAALALLRERGHRAILSEGGPTLMASLLASRLVDELFLTLSPLVAGRATAPRLALVEGAELLPGRRVEGALRSVRRAGEHLFLRYALAPSEELRFSDG